MLIPRYQNLYFKFNYAKKYDKWAISWVSYKNLHFETSHFFGFWKHLLLSSKLLVN